MASADTGVNMIPAGEGSSGNGPSSTNRMPSSIKPKRFEIRKWNAVALEDWDCAICRNCRLCYLQESYHGSVH